MNLESEFPFTITLTISNGDSPNDFREIVYFLKSEKDLLELVAFTHVEVIEVKFKHYFLFFIFLFTEFYFIIFL